MGPLNCISHWEHAIPLLIPRHNIQILLTLTHTLSVIFIGRNKLIIRSLTRVRSAHKSSSHQLINFYYLFLGETSCYNLKFAENLISSQILLTLTHKLPVTFFWEKQVVNQKFAENLISSQILLTLAHKLPVIFFWEKQVVNQKLFDKNRESSATHVTQKGNFPKKSLIYP